MVASHALLTSTESRVWQIHSEVTGMLFSSRSKHISHVLNTMEMLVVVSICSLLRGLFKWKATHILIKIDIQSLVVHGIKVQTVHYKFTHVLGFVKQH